MSIRLMVLLSGLLAGKAAGAQMPQQQTDTLVSRNEIYLKFSPLAILEPDGGPNFSGEYLFRQTRLGVQLEVQPVLFNVYHNLFDRNNGIGAPGNAEQSAMPLGFKLRPEIRYYIGGMQNRPVHTRDRQRLLDETTGIRQRNRTYIAAAFLYKYTQRERAGEFNIFNGGTTPAFRQFAVFTDVKQVFSADVRIGFVSPAFGSRHLFLEAYGGLGLRLKRFSYHHLPPGASPPLRNTVFFRGENGAPLQQSGVSLPVGLRVSYKFD